MPHKPCEIVLFTFGPIQTFIAASRRTQDLAASSLILSSLAKSALLEIEGRDDLDLVFPLKSGQEWARRLPNRIVFLAPQGQGEKAASALRNALVKHWKEISEGVKAFLLKHTSSADWTSEWDTQANEWLETYWVTIPWDGQDATYSRKFKTLNLGIDARKNVRHYLVSPQPGKKCTLSGIRSAVGIRNRTKGIWPDELRDKFRTHLKEGERLSAISAIKRFADRANALDGSMKRFPSTSSIASASFKATVLENWPTLEPLVNDFYGAVKALGLNIFTDPEPFPYLQEKAGSDRLKKELMRLEGDYFYRDFYRNLKLVNDARRDHLPTIAEGESPSELEKAAASLEALLQDAMQCAEGVPGAIPFPNTYYAALMMDGDYMGKLIDRAGSLKAHKNISRTMAKTASKIQELIETCYPGKLIYSSGDDVLALMPVNCVLEVAQKVRETFVKNMTDIGQEEADMSGGIAVMHHHSPLEAILTKARQAEHLAKEQYNRHTLVVTIAKRSGEDLSAVMHWLGEKDSNPLSSLLSYLISGAISSKFIYDLREEIPALLGNFSALKLEMSRLINRHLSPEIRNDSQKKKEIPILIEDLLGFRKHIPTKAENRFVELLNWLMVVRFLAQGERS